MPRRIEDDTLASVPPSQHPSSKAFRFALGLLAGCVIFATACAKSGPDAAMSRLGKRGYAYSVEEFQRAARSGDVQAVEDFLAAGMAVDVPDGKAATAMGAACLGDATDVVRVLLKAGASVSAPASDKRSPLMLTATAGSAPTARLLIENGADPRARDAEGWHPLALATWNHRVDVATVLAAQAPVDDLDDALLLASLRGDLEMVDILLRRGASVRSHDADGRTPLMLAAMNGHTAVAKRLIDNGANRFEMHSKSGWTPSQFAVQAEAEALAKGDTTKAALCREIAVMFAAAPAPAGDPAGVFEDPREILTIHPDAPPPDEQTSAAIAAGTVRLAQPLQQSTLPVPAPGFDGLATGWKFTEYRERPAPMVLSSVEPDNSGARFRPLFGSQQAIDVKAGQIIPGLPWRLVEVKRKMGKTKDDGTPVELSTAVIEVTSTGKRSTLVAGTQGASEEPYAVLVPVDGSSLVTARRGDTFRLTGDPAEYLVADISPEFILVEDTKSRQTRKISRR